MRFRAVRGQVAAVGLLAILGCGSEPAVPKAPVRPFLGTKLLVAAVGDMALLKTVEAQRGEWQETQGGEVTLADSPVEPKELRGADVLLFAGDRLGDLVDASALAVLPDSVVRLVPQSVPEILPEGATPAYDANPLDYADVLPAFRDRVTKYGSDRMALPFGGSALVLVYRRDAMERAANRSAAREAKLTLEPPRTWEQLDALARFFQGRDWDGDGASDAGIALALGPDTEGVGDAIFLARAAALGQHPHQYSFLFDADTMEPRIATPPFVEALAGLVALKDSGPPGMEKFDAEAAAEAFRTGKAALLIDRAERASRWTDPKHPAEVGVAALPGSDRVYEPMGRVWEPAKPANRPTYLPRGGGWLAAVASTTSGPRREAAIDFVKYLASPDTANRIRSDRTFPMLPTRSKLLEQGLPDPRSAPGVDSRKWSQAVIQTLTAPQVLPGLRIPEADGYLADLARARAAALGGDSAEGALKAAAGAWSERTRKLGPERPLWHYRRSLNVLITSPEPPAR